MSWRDLVDAWQKRQEKDDETRAILRGNRQMEEERKKFENWQKQFSCHVCGKLPLGPRTSDGSGTGGGDYSITNVGFGGERKDWSKPEGMIKCKSCDHWVCNDDECTHNGVCKRCWSRKTGLKF